MALSIIEDNRRLAIVRLSDAYSEIDRQCKRLRALAKGISTLLPAEPFKHPMLQGTGLAPEDAAKAAQRIKLRDGLLDALQLADMIDDIACTMDGSVSMALDDASKALGLPLPGEASHE